MDQKQLVYFKAIVEEGNISKAAERLRIPQPYLSSQLKNIETEIGVQLAVRSTRKLQLTDAGKRFYIRATQILDLMDTTITELEAFENGLQGTLTVGTIATSATILLPSSIQKFHQKYPLVQFEIQNMSTKKILESLKIGTIELGIIRSPFETSLYDFYNLPEQPMVAAQNTEYTDVSNIIQLSELSNKQLLVNYRFASIIDEACKDAGYEPKILCKVDDTRSILTWANVGMGIAIIPKDWINIIPDLNLYYREINAPSLNTRSALVWVKKRTLSVVARNFIEIFKNNFLT
ncbi:LysR family transcriptional regulator [Desulfosporosinus sp. FKB]|uniref:LysR family transcriptional regulator n=1 Tax=Desulfosporosinus sp. FKB TaxID=1969835 RepID=UPI000B49AEB5|nr:LysR family transcriptional regulator [Desulfosporosinus sp. FKB]